jgi:predicted nucleic acid-binding protein
MDRCVYRVCNAPYITARLKTHTQADMMIAATAQIHQLTLVTHNVHDFDGCGILLLNPFS